jgi:predicted S18 family serine protease
MKKKNKGGRCVLDLVAKKLQSSSEGKFSAYATYIVQELETLPKEMAMYCQRAINEAIFEAQMGSLNRTSRVITEPLYSIPPQQLTDQSTTSHFSTVESFAGQFFSHFQE